MKRNPQHWRHHLTELADTLQHTGNNWHRAINTITDMLPGLAGAPTGATTSSYSGTSIVERHALNTSAEQAQHHELVTLPADIWRTAHQLARLNLTEPGTNWGRIDQTRFLLHAATRQPKPPARTLQHLTQQIWRLDQLVTLWAIGEDRQRTLRKEAGGPASSNDEIWCLNCRQHGHTTPRHGSGLKNCKWCHDFKNEWGILPDAPLLDAHHRRRINSTDIQRALERAGSKRRVVA